MRISQRYVLLIQPNHDSFNGKTLALATEQSLKTRVDDLWTQMDKLWASAWRRNQTEITQHSKKIESKYTYYRKLYGFRREYEYPG